MAAHQVQISAFASEETRALLDEASAQDVASALAKPQEPTPAMRALMAGEDGDDVPG